MGRNRFLGISLVGIDGIPEWRSTRSNRAGGKNVKNLEAHDTMWTMEIIGFIAAALHLLLILRTLAPFPHQRRRLRGHLATVGSQRRVRSVGMHCCGTVYPYHWATKQLGHFPGFGHSMRTEDIRLLPHCPPTSPVQDVDPWCSTYPYFVHTSENQEPTDMGVTELGFVYPGIVPSCTSLPDN